MRKKLVLTLSTIGVLVAAAVLATNSDEAEKFLQKTCTQTNLKGINAFVCDLRLRLDALTTRVDNIPAGPPGAPGQPGQPGAPGPQGPAGPAGAGLKLIDANGATIGPITNAPLPPYYPNYIVWYESIRKLVLVDISKPGPLIVNVPITNGDTLYKESDCSGLPYVHGDPYQLYAISTTTPNGNKYGWSYYGVEDYSKVETIHSLSKWSSAINGCVSADEVTDAGQAVGLVPPAFQGPLRITE